jgi:DNA repair protein RecO (recombination protein O)
MKQFVTKGIVLTRTNFGEADRIITFLTPDHGKIRLMARGVRKLNSKLAGGVELFSIAEISFIRGRGEIGTLSSARLNRHFARITTDIVRTMTGYDLIKKLNKITEDETEAGYFELLTQTLEALDDVGVSSDVIKLWFTIQLLRLGGHTPNLRTDVEGNQLMADSTYRFDYNTMSFAPSEDGPFDSNQIKFLRIGFSGNAARILEKVSGSQTHVSACMPLVEQLSAALSS